MPFKRGKSHVTTLSQASQAAFIAVERFRSFFFLFTKEVIDEGAFVSEDGPDGHYKIIADRVSLALFEINFAKSPATASAGAYVLYTKRVLTDDPSAWKFSLLEQIDIGLDAHALEQTKKRQRGAFVRRHDGELDVKEAVPIRIRIPHK